MKLKTYFDGSGVQSAVRLTAVINPKINSHIFDFLVLLFFALLFGAGIKSSLLFLATVLVCIILPTHMMSNRAGMSLAWFNNFFIIVGCWVLYLTLIKYMNLEFLAPLLLFVLFLFRDTGNLYASHQYVERGVKNQYWLALFILPVLFAHLLHDSWSGEHHAAWLMAYTNALQDGLPPESPFWAGTKLSYHYFYNIFASYLLAIPGMVHFDLVRVLMPLVLFFYTAKLLIYTIGHNAKSSVFAVCCFVTVFACFGYSDILYRILQTANLNISYRLPSIVLALGLTLAVFNLLANVMQSSHAQRNQLLAILVCLFAISGSRANVLPMVICGLMLCMVWRLLFRPSANRFSTRLEQAWVVLAMAVGVFALSYYWFYSGGLISGNLMHLNSLNDTVARTKAGDGGLSVLFNSINDYLDSRKISVILFVLTIVLMKKSAAILALVFTISGSSKRHSRFDISEFEVFLLGFWVSGIAVLLLFANLTNEQWAFYFFAQFAGLLFLARLFESLKNFAKNVVLVFMVLMAALQLCWFFVDVVTLAPAKKAHFFSPQQSAGPQRIDAAVEFFATINDQVYIINATTISFKFLPALNRRIKLYVDHAFMYYARASNDEEINNRRVIVEQLSCEVLSQLVADYEKDFFVIVNKPTDRKCLHFEIADQTMVIYRVL